MASNANSMLNKPSTRHHPWTRVSWISGSDIDSLDEEEVQEVESITFGRASNPAPTAASSVVSPGNNNSNNLDDMSTPPPPAAAASVTLKPFSFGPSGGGGEELTGSGSALSPFVFTDDNESNNNNSAPPPLPFANSAPCLPFGIQPAATAKDIFASQKGQLITPAEDAVSEEDATAGDTKKTSSWKSFWGNGATLTSPDNKEEEEDDVNKEEPEEEEEADEDIVVEEPELVEEEPTVDWAALLLKLCAQVCDGCTAVQEMAKGCFFWVMEGLLMLWTKWVAFGILLNTWFQNGIATLKTNCQNSTSQAITACQESKIPAPALLGFGLILCMCGAALVLPSKTPPSPTNDLRDFVRFEKAHNVVDLTEIDDLNTEAFRTYARSTCVSAATYEQARAALDVGLYGVPDSVRTTLVQMAIMEGVTQKNSVQDSNSDFVNSGKADAFMAFWSTVYDPKEEIDTYKTCVMVTGVALTVAETIAEWTSKQEKYQIGTEPCHCGYVYCEECPIFDHREVKWPVFERRSLSLRKQEELRRWMVDQAVKSAEHLVLDGGSSDYKLEAGSSSDLVQSHPSFAWTGQTSAAFFGGASHQDRVAPGGGGNDYTGTGTTGGHEEEEEL